ncbi:MAG: hypothetical protein AB7L28_02480 [Kofleriaceae bacterium]
MRSWVPLLVLCAISPAAIADPGDNPSWPSAAFAAPLFAHVEVVPASHHDAAIDQRWPAVPRDTRLSLGDQLTDELTEMGNQLGYHLGPLSTDLVGLRFAGRKRRARVQVGSDTGQYLVFKLRSDVQFADGVARIHANVDLGIAGRTLHLELPELEMATTEYRGERGVELRLPLLKQAF